MEFLSYADEEICYYSAGELGKFFGEAIVAIEDRFF